MKIFIILGFTFLFSVAIMGQDEVNYKPKALQNELSKQKELNINDMQELQIQDTLLQKQLWKGKFYTFDNLKSENRVKYVYIGRVNSCRAGGCSLYHTKNDTGENEYFDYFILFDKNISVYKIKVFNYRATHGQEVTAPGWLKQFVGYNGGKNLDVGRDVDAISGATISVYGITADIESRTKWLQEIVLDDR